MIIALLLLVPVLAALAAFLGPCGALRPFTRQQ